MVKLTSLNNVDERLKEPSRVQSFFFGALCQAGVVKFDMNNARHRKLFEILLHRMEIFSRVEAIHDDGTNLGSFRRRLYPMMLKHIARHASPATSPEKGEPVDDDLEQLEYYLDGIADDCLSQTLFFMKLCGSGVVVFHSDNAEHRLLYDFMRHRMCAAFEEHKAKATCPVREHLNKQRGALYHSILTDIVRHGLPNRTLKAKEPDIIDV